MNKFLPYYILNIFLILLFLSPFGTLVKKGANFLISPVNYIVYSSAINVNDTYSSLNKLFEYKNMYEKNNEELINFKSQYALENQQQKLLNEHSLYRELEKNSNAKVNIAQIIGFSDISGSFFIRLNKGSIDNLKVGDTVIYKNYLIGKLTEVKDSISYASVFFLSDNKLLVRGLKNDTNFVLTCKSGFCELINVLNSENLNENEILITAGSLDSYQEGFIVGSVLKIHTTPENVFKRADIKQEIDIKKISKVAIVSYEK